METFSTKQVGVWMDQAKAYLIGVQEGNAYLLEIVASNISRLKREDGEDDDKTRFSSNPQQSSPNEYKKNQVKTNELHGYFKKLQSKLNNFEDILILGPGTVKDQFFNELLVSQAFAGKECTSANKR